MKNIYDCAVIGLGGFGSVSAFHLARAGASVLGLEQFDNAHDQGSSHGETRIIRKAYFEHPDYVPLLERSYELVEELEHLSNSKLYEECGLMVSGPSSGEVIRGIKLANELHQVPIEPIAVEEVSTRFPGFRIPLDFETIFEKQAGYLKVEKCVQAHWTLAEQHGATLIPDSEVTSWQATSEGFSIQTKDGEHHARKMVITAGAWSAKLLKDIGVPLRVVRKVLTWHPVRSQVYSVQEGGSAFFFEMPEGQFYGFPSIDGQSVKLAEHTGGTEIDSPADLDRRLLSEDERPLTRFIDEVMPELQTNTAKHAVCMYTMTPDAHFLVDEHPDFAGLYLGAGFSGHGFKFTPVLGEALSDLVLHGQTRQPVGFLGLGRFN